MKAVEIATAFAGIFAAQTVGGAGLMYLLEQSSQTIVLPALIFDVTTRALNDKGTALAYTLTVWVESSADRALPTDPDPAPVHAAVVELVRQKLHGTGKTALLAALNLSFAYGFDFRSWSAVESDPSMDGNHFRTPVLANGVALVV